MESVVEFCILRRSHICISRKPCDLALPPLPTGTLWGGKTLPLCPPEGSWHWQGALGLLLGGLQLVRHSHHFVYHNMIKCVVLRHGRYNQQLTAKEQCTATSHCKWSTDRSETHGTNGACIPTDPSDASTHPRAPRNSA